MTTPNARRPPATRQLLVVAGSLVVGFLLPIVLIDAVTSVRSGTTMDGSTAGHR